MIGAASHNLADFVPTPEPYRYVLCWNGGQDSHETIMATLVNARDRIQRGESVHIYPMLREGA